MAWSSGWLSRERSNSLCESWVVGESSASQLGQLRSVTLLSRLRATQNIKSLSFYQTKSKKSTRSMKPFQTFHWGFWLCWCTCTALHSSKRSANASVSSTSQGKALAFYLHSSVTCGLDLNSWPTTNTTCVRLSGTWIWTEIVRRLTEPYSGQALNWI